MLKGYRYILFTIIFSGIFICPLKSQILKDPVAFEKIKEGVENIYDLKFDDAKKDYWYIKSRYPGNSIPYLFKGMMIYWEYFPLIPGTAESKLFVENLEKCLDLSEKYLKKNGDDAEHLLSGLGALGMLLMYYADNGQTRNVIGLAAPTYEYVMKAFDYTNVYSDFYFITGLYNYYREAYPEARPIYRPVVVFFPHGNKKLGLQQLKIASDSAIFLQAEAFSFLAGIYLTFENNPSAAVEYSRRLVSRHQNNIIFQTGYVRDLLLDKKYSKAEEILDSIPYPVYNRYLQARIDVFKGVLYEKKFKNDKMAEQYYWSGVSKSEEYKTFANDYEAYAYFGLSRISERKGDKKNMKKYRKLADNMAPYAYINFDD